MKRRIKGLTSTVILAVCLIIALVLAQLLFSVNLSEALSDYKQSLEGEDLKADGEMMLLEMLVIGIGVAIVTGIIYLIAILTLVSSAIPLIFAIKNLRAENKVVKIINIIYLPLFSLISAFALLKLILFIVGIG